ncbi:hypothetical protein ACA910_022467 [Epithemia clementina (nom. ined.)]
MELWVHVLGHSEVGGILDARFWFSIAEKVKRPEHTSAINYALGQEIVGIKAASLQGVLDPTVPGPCCPASSEKEDGRWLKPNLQELNSRLKLQSVFSSSGFACQKLTPKESGGAFDFPLKIIEGGIPEVLREWLQEIEVPFKVRAEVVRCLACWTKSACIKLQLTSGQLPLPGVVADKMDSGRKHKSDPEQLSTQFCRNR